jgi:hypothetical protein
MKKYLAFAILIAAVTGCAQQPTTKTTLQPTPGARYNGEPMTGETYGVFDTGVGESIEDAYAFPDMFKIWATQMSAQNAMFMTTQRSTYRSTTGRYNGSPQSGASYNNQYPSNTHSSPEYNKGSSSQGGGSGVGGARGITGMGGSGAKHGRG